MKHYVVQAFSKPAASHKTTQLEAGGPLVAMESPCVLVWKVLVDFKRSDNSYSAVSLLMQHFVTNKGDKCLFLLYVSHSTGTQILMLVFNLIKRSGKRTFYSPGPTRNPLLLSAQGVWKPCGPSGLLWQKGCKCWGQSCGQAKQTISLGKFLKLMLKTMSAPY